MVKLNRLARLLVCCAGGLAGCNGVSGDGAGGPRTDIIPAAVEPPAVAPPCALDTRPESTGMPDEARIFGWIADLVDIGYRRSGTPAGYAAAAYVKCQLEAMGLEDVHYETATTWSWQVTGSGVQVDGEPLDAFPAAHSFVTPDAPSTFSTGTPGLTAELVDVGLATPEQIALADIEGKIAVFDLKFLLPPAGFAALVEFLWDPEATIVEPSFLVGNPYITNYENAIGRIMDAGAAGFIGVLADYFESNRYYNEYYRRLQVTIPGFWVSPGTGARLRERLAQGAAEATLVMQGSRREAEARTVVGFLHGASKDTIMVQSHHDSVFSGAVEDGSGTAAVLAQAQYFASQPAESRDKTLMFATFDSHFTGYHAHRAFVEKYVRADDPPYNIVANVTLEHIGRQGIKDPQSGELQTTDQPEVRGVIENLGPTLKVGLISSIVNHDLRRTAVLNGSVLCPTGLMPTDAGFICAAGVPTASLISGPNYLYDEADTLDKVAREDLVPVTRIFSELIEEIDSTPTPLIGVPLAAPLYDEGASEG